MTLPIFPTSPLPLNLQRTPMWGETVQTFDSGNEQASTPWVKPLYRYQIGLSNIQVSKQSSLMAFYHLVKGRTSPWLFTDPYENVINFDVCVSCGTSLRSFYVRGIEGFPVIPNSSGFIMTSALSTLTVNSHYSWSFVTGIFSTHIVPSSIDTWTARGTYFKKCKFDSYQDTSPIWNIFNGSVTWHEIALS